MRQPVSPMTAMRRSSLAGSARGTPEMSAEVAPAGTGRLHTRTGKCLPGAARIFMAARAPSMRACGQVDWSVTARASSPPGACCTQK